MNMKNIYNLENNPELLQLHEKLLMSFYFYIKMFLQANLQNKLKIYFNTSKYILALIQMQIERALILNSFTKLLKNIVSQCCKPFSVNSTILLELFC